MTMHVGLWSDRGNIEETEPGAFPVLLKTTQLPSLVTLNFPGPFSACSLISSTESNVFANARTLASASFRSASMARCLSSSSLCCSRITLFFSFSSLSCFSCCSRITLVFSSSSLRCSSCCWRTIFMALLTRSFVSARSRITCSATSSTNCLNWLAGRPPRSPNLPLSLAAASLVSGFPEAANARRSSLGTDTLPLPLVRPRPSRSASSARLVCPICRWTRSSVRMGTGSSKSPGGTRTPATTWKSWYPHSGTDPCKRPSPPVCAIPRAPTARSRLHSQSGSCAGRPGYSKVGVSTSCSSCDCSCTSWMPEYSPSTGGQRKVGTCLSTLAATRASMSLRALRARACSAMGYFQARSGSTAGVSMKMHGVAPCEKSAWIVARANLGARGKMQANSSSKAFTISRCCSAKGTCPASVKTTVSRPGSAIMDPRWRLSNFRGSRCLEKRVSVARTVSRKWLTHRRRWASGSATQAPCGQPASFLFVTLRNSRTSSRPPSPTPGMSIRRRSSPSLTAVVSFVTPPL
mmetsp:Transcript_36377/g.108701  ORF Transcript_36377/g.108701 Transcript_36377/m.108701 type:complete len:521 (-) Transcript_36377:566-2128(-)